MFWSFGKNFENDLRVIFDQSVAKLSLGLDLEPETPILKVIFLRLWGLDGPIFPLQGIYNPNEHTT